MKILILSIFSNDTQYYEKMLQIQRKYVHNYENVDVYFVQGGFDHNEDVYIENDMIYVRTHENFNTILYKTLSAMDTLKNLWKKEYDFTIRTNISTIINIPKMIEILHLFQDKEYMYAGDKCGIIRLNKPIHFVLGTVIILSKKLADKMICERNKFTDKIEDDVAIGLYVQENIPIAYDHNLSLSNRVFYTHTLENGWNSTVHDMINYKNKNDHLFNYYICYRNKTNNRNEDVKIMDYICTQLFH
jgi:hypothetical protein